MTAKLEGDWTKVSKLLSSLDTQLRDKIKVGVHQAALETEKTLVLHIKNQDLKWAELKDSYLKRKIKKGQSNQIYIATSTLLNSITNVLTDEGFEAFVGVLRKGKSRKGVPGVLIAAVLEYGSPKRNILSRPLFAPTWVEMKPKFIKRMEKAVEEALNV